MTGPRRSHHGQIRVLSDACRGCHLCQLACSFYKTGVFRLSNSRVGIRRNVDKIERYGVSLLDTCDDCGWCVRFCGYGALQMVGGKLP